jgi:hypothetical protein
MSADEVTAACVASGVQKNGVGVQPDSSRGCAQDAMTRENTRGTFDGMWAMEGRNATALEIWATTHHSQLFNDAQYSAERGGVNIPIHCPGAN